MRSKAPLALMEQLVMILVFALAAALCLQAFALSQQVAKKNEQRDQAMLQAQNVAEAVKGCAGDYEQVAALWGGEWNGRTWSRFVDAHWQSTEEGGVYQISVVPGISGLSLLETADITVTSAEGTCLAQLSVAWQKVVAHE